MTTQPPAVESSNDCGKWPSVMPCAASAASIAGPGAPAPKRAVRSWTSIACSAASRSSEMLTTGRSPSGTRR